MGRALLIVDFQNDFATPSGALAVEGGEDITAQLNEEAASGRYEFVVATRDWHPVEHGSFAEQGGPWPTHCVQGTEGAELHPDLDRDRIDLVFDKGEDASAPGYSAFEAGELATLLRERGIDKIAVAGLATDYCVKHSALDALAHDFEVEVLVDATRGVDATDSERALRELEARGAALG